MDFVAWLRTPFESTKVTSLKPIKPTKKAKTINLIITAVTNFYDYVFRNGEIQTDMLQKLNKQLFTGERRKYKDFLHHVNKNKISSRNILKVKEPKIRINVLSKEEVEFLYNSTNNIRDKLLIQLLYETGLRIGEALSLYIEDIKLDHKNGHRIQLVDRGELENGARLKIGERNIFISQTLIDLFDDYLYEVLDELELDSNFVFIKLRGENLGKPMEYSDVVSLFKRLSKKTGIKVHPHLFRHTHATIFYKQTKDIKQVQERLGHSQIQTTLNLYLHSNDEEIRKNWEKAQSAFRMDSYKE